MPTQEQITKKLTAIAKKAVLAHPKSKLYAKVNHEDNFALVQARPAKDAMMDEICRKIDAKNPKVRNAWIDWLNQATSTPARNPRHTCFDAVALSAARAVYKQLRKSK